MTKEEAKQYVETCKNIIDSLPAGEDEKSFQWRTVRDLFHYVSVYGEDGDFILLAKAEEFKFGVDEVVKHIKEVKNKDLEKETILWER